MEATKYGVFTRSEEEKVSGKCTIKWEILFFLQFAAEFFFLDRVQKYNSIHREKTFHSSFSANPIFPSLKWLNVHLQIIVEVKDKWEVSFQREETSFQANIHNIRYNLNEETKQTKNSNIRKKKALSLENWENGHKTLRKF